MSDIPCKDCITFAVCNAQITDIMPYSDVIYYLIPKCSLIKDYTKYYKNHFPSELVIGVAKFFKPYGVYNDSV